MSIKDPSAEIASSPSTAAKGKTIPKIPIGASLIIQPIRMSIASRTPSKKPVTSSRGAVCVRSNAAANNAVKISKGKMSPLLAAAIGLAGIKPTNQSLNGGSESGEIFMVAVAKSVALASGLILSLAISGGANKKV